MRNNFDKRTFHLFWAYLCFKLNRSLDIFSVYMGQTIKAQNYDFNFSFPVVLPLALWPRKCEISSIWGESFCLCSIYALLLRFFLLRFQLRYKISMNGVVFLQLVEKMKFYFWLVLFWFNSNSIIICFLVLQSLLNWWCHHYKSTFWWIKVLIFYLIFRL